MKKTIPVRDARDRLIDLLGIGRTAPLRDLDVVDNPLIVAINTPARIPIASSQRDVFYALHDQNGALDITAWGTGDTISLSTAPIAEDQTLKIAAQKRSVEEILAQEPATGRQAILHQQITIKVGLDLQLNAWIAGEQHLEPSSLHRENDNLPRIIHYGEAIRVKITNSQEGIKYQLIQLQVAADATQVNEVEISQNVVTGNLGEIELSTTPFFEDAFIRVKATKTFDEAEENDETAYLGKALFSADIAHATALNNQTIPSQVKQKFSDAGIELLNVSIAGKNDLWLITNGDRTEFTVMKTNGTLKFYLDLILPLKVRANTALAIAADPEPIIDFASPINIKTEISQASASYQLFIHTVRDSEFIHGEVPAGIHVAMVDVPDEPDVQVIRPAPGLNATVPTEYEAASNPMAGTGGDLVLSTLPLQKDSMILVKAQKSHFAHDPANPERQVVSSVVLQQVVVALVQPNPDQELNFAVEIENGKTTDSLLVDNGQPGVFYFMRTQSDGDAIAQPAYFHKKDDEIPALNKGLNLLNIGVDFVIARGSKDAQISSDPMPPILSIPTLPVGTDLFINAMKAQTRVMAALHQNAHISAVPDIHLEKTEVEAGKQTKIQIIASQTGEKYRPFWDGQLQRSWKSGNGNDITFNTPPIDSDMEIEMHIVETNNASLSVTRIVKLVATVLSE